jgi:glycosyltransferase involved in cell wall biosynthesis
MNRLTIIIPFLNEGIEIENTLRSIRETAGNTVDILLINDCSTDEFHYAEVSSEFNSGYHLNTERMGVAASRDLGIFMIDTPYFLLLDGHMRFYDNSWAKRIADELEKDERVLLCCQTKALNKVDGKLIELSNRPTSMGAYVNFSETGIILEADWLWKESLPLSQGNIHAIPCVLGAAYAGSKNYWQYLNGLSGLQFYGSDEVYISIKVWLEGGQCKLLEDIVVGHLYRDESPYTFDYTYRLYNKLLIAELILPERMKKHIFARSKVSASKLHIDSCLLLYQNIDKIIELKKCYQQIFTKDIGCFEQLNNAMSQQKAKDKAGDDLLVEIADHILQKHNTVSELGILRGKMGVILFLFHYAQYSNNDVYRNYANQLMEEIYQEITLELPINFSTGFCGIGWGIGYLIQHGFLVGDADDVLEDVDKQIMERDPLRISDLSVETGLAGILLYVLSRMSYAQKNERKLPFDSAYLSALSKKVDTVISQADLHNLASTDIILKYAAYTSTKATLENTLSIFDFTYPVTPPNCNITDIPLGLNGSSGIGIKLILERIQLN